MNNIEIVYRKCQEQWKIQRLQAEIAFITETWVQMCMHHRSIELCCRSYLALFTKNVAWFVRIVKSYWIWPGSWKGMQKWKSWNLKSWKSHGISLCFNFLSYRLCFNHHECLCFPVVLILFNPEFWKKKNFDRFQRIAEQYWFMVSCCPSGYLSVWRQDFG